ncbi:MAG: restriction endonuclease subunit S [Desulfobulbus sp.]|nr:restriction endonuclease subunit S [Desulfobulbus sp.]
MITPISIDRRRLKYLSLLNMGQSPYSKDVTRFDEGNGLPFLQGNAEFGASSPSYKHTCNNPPKIAKQGDLLVSVRAPVGALNIADKTYGIGRGLCAITWKSIEERFGWWAMHYHRGKLSEVATGSTYEAVSVEDLGNLFISFPDLKTQRLIADYLDRETARIDELVTEKEKMLVLLEEKRAVLISRAVTRGLDPTVPLKPSGLDWLGDIPAHWKTKKLKHIASLKSGETITADSISDTGDYPVYGGNGFRGFTSEYTHVGNHVLIGRQGALCGNINYASGQFWASEHAVVTTTIIDADVFWLGELLRFMNLNQYSQSAAQPGISVEIVENLKIPVPPVVEQAQIAAFMKKESDYIETIRDEISKSTALLKERRATLITAAVTGQIPEKEMWT